MARLALTDKDASDSRFLPFLRPIRREANDDRNQVRKAVNWALRQIGKRNQAGHTQALEIVLYIWEWLNNQNRLYAFQHCRSLWKG